MIWDSYECYLNFLDTRFPKTLTPYLLQNEAAYEVCKTLTWPKNQYKICLQCGVHACSSPNFACTHVRFDFLANRYSLYSYTFPLLLPLIGLLLLLGAVAGRLAQKERLATKMKLARNKLHTGCFLVLWFIYPCCCSKIFHFFVCDTMPDGVTSYLRVDYSLDCDAPARAAFRAYAVLMGLLYPVGTPLAFWYFLRGAAAELRQMWSPHVLAVLALGAALALDIAGV